MIRLLDHTGSPVTHHRIQTNGIEMHAITAGEGEPLLLLHGTPKTHIYWSKLLPLLTPKFKVIAPDLRGAGLSGHPYAENGNVSSVMAQDLIGLLDELGVDSVALHGEDRGAEYGFVLAGLFPERVKALSFAEMMLSGFGLEERSFFTEKNITEAKQRKGVWEWHIPFFYAPEVAELLIAGKEKEFWTDWLRKQCFDATLLPQDHVDEWIALLSTPHGLRGTLDTYKATLENAGVNKQVAAKVKQPVMAIGASHFFAGLVAKSLNEAGVDVAIQHVFDNSGHSLALEQPEKLADALAIFFRTTG